MQQYMLTRSLITVLLLLCLYSMAAGQLAGPDGSPTIFPYLSPGARQIMPLVQYSGAFVGGRQLSVVEGGVDFGITNRISLGASYLGSSGHGRSAQNTYSGDGQHYWANYHFLTVGAHGPIFGLLLDRVHDDVALHYQSSSTIADAWSRYGATGAQLTGQLQRGCTRFLGRAGLYSVDNDGSYLATLALLGGGVNETLSRHLSAIAQLTGYQDHYYGGSHMSYELNAGLTYAPTAHTGISFSGSLFPRGVPIACTPFSAASTAGLLFGGSATEAFRTETIGYLSLSGHVSF